MSPNPQHFAIQSKDDDHDHDAYNDDDNQVNKKYTLSYRPLVFTALLEL